MAVFRLTQREPPPYAKAALQSLARGETIPCRLRLALAYGGDSEVRKIRWNGVLGLIDFEKVGFAQIFRSFSLNCYVATRHLRLFEIRNYKAQQASSKSMSSRVCSARESKSVSVRKRTVKRCLPALISGK
jgi:hypothetical protein